MKDRTKYTREIHLRHDEQVAKANIQTGEVEIIKDKDSSKTNPEMKRFEPDLYFQRTYTEAWKLLKTQTTPNEFRVAFELAIRAKAFTNSLEPLDDETTALQLAEEFNLDRNTAKKTFNKLFDLGVFARFEVTEHDKIYKKYWVFNPYLAFNGKAINKKTEDLFSNTTYAKIMRYSG